MNYLLVRKTVHLANENGGGEETRGLQTDFQEYQSFLFIAVLREVSTNRT